MVIDLLDRAAAENRDSPLRRGATVCLPKQGRLLATGDLHDHGLNFHRAVKLAELSADPGNHLLLQEIVHGPRLVNGRDLSVRMLARAASLKCDFPAQVHFVQSNHELAQYLGEEILKGTTSAVEAFYDGVEFIYADDADEVMDAVGGFIRSLPLAVRCPNGVICTHSLPSARQLESFDPGVLERDLQDQDLVRNGPVYKLVWGRNHTQAVLDTLKSAWDVKLFVVGHQPVDMGYETVGDAMLIINADHSHGVALPIDLGRDYDLPELVGQLVPLASVVM